MTIRTSVLASLCWLAACAGTPPASGDAAATRVAGDPLPTADFRREHAGIREHLEHLHTMVGGLAAQTPAERGETMEFVVRFLEEHIRKHAEAEEAILYPAVDQRAAKGRPFTATMRREHVIVGRWIDDLAREAARPAPDAVAFARQTDRLLGLITAHFEAEEEVLLPVLDATMTRAEFEREVGSRLRH